jgi:hypothetical protein
MTSALAKGGLVVGLAPAMIVAGLVVFLNLEYYPISSDLAPPGFAARVDGCYGWPRTCCTTIKFVANPVEVERVAEGGLPIFPPRWVTRNEYNSGDLAFNITWCSVIILITWLASAYVFNSRVKWR